MTDRAVPNLPSRSFDATEAFYAGFGFDRIHREEGWLIIARGGIVLEFFPHRDADPGASSFMCSIRVDDVDELYAAILIAGVPERRGGFPRLRPVELSPWGARVGHLVDIDGTQFHLIGNGRM